MHIKLIKHENAKRVNRKPLTRADIAAITGATITPSGHYVSAARH